jgi:hypothetical protein
LRADVTRGNKGIGDNLNVSGRLIERFRRWFSRDGLCLCLWGREELDIRLEESMRWSNESYNQSPTSIKQVRTRASDIMSFQVLSLRSRVGQCPSTNNDARARVNATFMRRTSTKSSEIHGHRL